MNRLYLHALLNLASVGINLSADYVLQNYSENTVLKAVCDSLAHATTSGIVWLTVESEMFKFDRLYHSLGGALLCAMFAALMDGDHFLAAKSFRLKAAVSLLNRPVLHNTTLTLGLTSILLAASFWYRPFLWACAFSFAVWFPHHCRDANRRGFWIWPLGSTAALPTRLYIALILLCPWAIILIMRRFDATFRTTKHISDVINL